MFYLKPFSTPRHPQTNHLIGLTWVFSHKTMGGFLIKKSTEESIFDANCCTLNRPCFNRQEARNISLHNFTNHLWYLQLQKWNISSLGSLLWDLLHSRRKTFWKEWPWWFCRTPRLQKSVRSEWNWGDVKVMTEKSAYDGLSLFTYVKKAGSFGAERTRTERLTATSSSATLWAISLDLLDRTLLIHKVTQEWTSAKRNSP